MSLIFLSKVSNKYSSDIRLKNTTLVKSTFHSHKIQIESPEFSLSESLLAYDNKDVTINLIFANNTTQAEEFAMKGKGKIYQGRLKVKHNQRNTEIDCWLDTDIILYMKKETLDIKEMFKNKQGKGVYLEMR